MEREHNPSLICQLKSDHKRLFNIYNELYNSFTSNSDHKIIEDKLNQLKIMLIIHINFEDALLYSYLKGRYKDSSKISFIDNSNQEMGSISEVALNFIKECSNPELYHKHKERFQQELEIIGDILVKRVEFEEDRLYPLYTL
jgi:regulator of sigma D